MRELKIGDKVVIRDDLVGCRLYSMFNRNNEEVFTTGMLKFLGTTQEVEVTCPTHHSFKHAPYSWTDEMIDWDRTEKANKPMPIELLETGMVVEIRNGDVMLVLKGKFPTRQYGEQGIMFIDKFGFMTINGYDGYLKDIENKEFDVMKIYKRDVCGLVVMLHDRLNEVLIWERKEQKTVKMTSGQLLEKLGLDGNTKLEIEG